MRNFACVLFFGWLLSNPDISAQPATVTVSDQALTFIRQKTITIRKQFLIFDGRDSAFNHGFPSGAFGSPGRENGPQLNTGCVFSQTSPNGCGGGNDFDPNGTVLQLTFPPLRDQEYIGMNFEEPEHIPPGSTPPGYDLTNSNELVFDAIAFGDSPNVILSIGDSGVDDNTRAISDSWQAIHIPLPGLRRRVNNLLAVTEVGPSPINYVLLKNIRVNPVPAFQSSWLGLPLSFEAFGVVPSLTIGTGLVPVPIDQVLANLSATSDVASALLALLQSNGNDDAAKQIADALVAALQHDNQGLPIPHAADGSRGLRNAYMGGDLTLQSDQAPLDPGKPAVFGHAGDVRLPGFSVGPNEPACGPSHFCLVLNGASGGSNAIAILALVAASKRFDPAGSDTGKIYLSAAREIGRWIHGMLGDPQGYGGYVVGYPDQGAPPDHLIRGKSTAENAAIFAAFRALSASVQDSAESQSWNARANASATFVESMFDNVDKSFYSGTVGIDDLKYGVPIGVIPDGPRSGRDIINIYDYADAQLIPILAMAGAGRTALTVADWQSAFKWLQPMKRELPGDNGAVISGINLVSRPSPGSPDGITWQYTAQAALALGVLNLLQQDTRYTEMAAQYVSGLEWAQNSSGALPAATLDRRVTAPDACISMPFQCVPARASLGATAWAIFAELKFNPFAPAKGN